MSELENYRGRSADLLRARKLKVGVWIISILVLVLVGLMRRPEFKIALPDGVTLWFLPPFHAVLNTGASLALIGALVAIKARRVVLHQRFIYLALGLSALFLLSYVVYHFTSSETLYGDANRDGVLQESETAAVGAMRSVYLAVLLSHIALAASGFPFILMTFVYGFTNQFAKHRRMARWVFPVWLYVAVTGPVCYLMLRPYY